MEKISRISNELKDWIMNMLKSGVNPELIVDALIKKGFDVKFSYTLLFQLLRNQSVETESKPIPYQYDTPSIGRKGEHHSYK